MPYIKRAKRASHTVYKKKKNTYKKNMITEQVRWHVLIPA